MKKMNKKGFTLVELLAVIVVLAIIMVIATQQVNSTIKKSRGNSFYETAQSIRKSMQTVCATDNKIDTIALNNAIEASDVNVTVSGEEGSIGTVTITAETGGKFTNITKPDYNEKIYTWNTDNTISFSTECPVTTTESNEN